MATKIDSLQNSTTLYQRELIDLRSNINVATLEKAQTLTENLENTKKNVELELSSLQNKTDSISVQETKKAKDLLEDVGETLEQAKQLRDSITTKTVDSTAISSVKSNPTIRDNVKGALGTALNWGAEHRKGLTLSAGAILGGTWLYKTLTKEDEEDDEDEEDEEDGESKKKKKKKKSKSEKGFWDKWYGKALKWTGIGVGAGTLGYWIAKKFGWIKDGEMTDRADDQASETVKLKEKDPEKFDKYKGVGEKVDSQYNQIMKKEIDSGWGGMSIADGYEKYADKQHINKDTFQATVPMCIDNEYVDVNTFLSEGGYYSYLRGKNITELKTEILGWGKEKIGKILGPFLSCLTSFIPFKGDDWAKSVENWFNGKDAVEISSELDLFFRQYAKVLSFMQIKMLKLKEKIAKEKMQVVGTQFSSVEDALNDEEWVETYVNSDERYKNFMGGKIFQAVDVMKANDIFDDKLSLDMQKITEACDSERGVILQEKDGKDFFKKIDESNGNLTTEQYQEGVEVCDNVIKDINDEFDKSVSYAYFSCIHELFNTDENNLQEFLKQSGFLELKNGLLLSMAEFKQKLASGNISQDELKIFKDQINSYFAMKKEILIGSKAIQQMKSDNSDAAERILNTVCAFGKNLWTQTLTALEKFKDGNYIQGWLLATLPLMLGGTVLKIAGKEIPIVGKVGTYMVKANILNVGAWGLKTGGRQSMNWLGNLDNVPNIILKARYSGSHGKGLLVQDLIEGKISASKADGISSRIFSGASYTDIIKNNISADVSIENLHINDLFDGDVRFMKNGALRNQIFEVTNTGSVTDILSDGTKVKKYKIKHGGELYIEKIHTCLGKCKNLKNSESKLLAKLIIENGDFKELSSLDKLINNIENIGTVDLTKLNKSQISQLADDLCKNIDELGDTAKLEKRVGSIAGSASEILSDTRKSFNKIIDDTIDILKELPDTRIKNIRINTLNKLKTATDLAEDEIKSFIKLVENGLEPKSISIFIDILHSEKKIEGIGSLGAHMKQLLGEGKISEFNSVLKDSKVKTALKDVDVDYMVKNLDSVIQKFGSKLNDLRNIVKSAFKIIAKLL